MILRRLILALGLLAALVVPALAVNPDEVLKDPALEARARALSAGLRCLVCQNQSIDDSNAELARDLRVLLRKRLVAGDTDEQVIDYVVGRYGDYVLLKPRFNARTALLWGAPAAFLVIGVIAAAVTLRRRSQGRVEALTPEEEARLKALLDGEPKG